MNQYTSNNLKLKINNYPQGIMLMMYSPIIYTSNLPKIVDFLKKNLPSILQSQCFNPKNLSFREEVKQTEVGHLFEHILLEYLCEQKFREGVDDISFEGHTDWNWKIFPQGTYEIYIDYKEKCRDCFDIALKQTINLFNKIVENSYTNDATGSCSAARSHHLNR